jgi:hypothetical protein
MPIRQPGRPHVEVGAEEEEEGGPSWEGYEYPDLDASAWTVGY